MSQESEEKMDAAELAAAELVSRVKQIKTNELELPIVDESCVWTVSVKKMGIIND
jgi:hypothetical protein